MTILKYPLLIFSLGASIFAAPLLLQADESAESAALNVGHPDSLTISIQKLTLASAIEEAMVQNPTFDVITAEIESARGGILTAQTRPKPELTLAPGLKRLSEGNTSSNELQGTIAYSQTILFPGKRELLISLAERNVELRELGIEGLRFQLTAAVRRAFYEMLAAQNVIGLREQQIESAITFHQAAVKRVESGYASDFEAVRSQGEVISARRLLVVAEGRITAARVELNTLLGRDPSMQFEAIGTLESSGDEPPLRDLMALAIKVNPSLHTQALRAKIARLNVRRARLARKSDWSIGPSLEYSKSEQVLGFSATIPLTSKSYGRGEILTAGAEQQRVLADTERLRREITGAVVKAASQLANARTQLALYSPAYLDQLKTVVDQAERSYAQSVTSLLIYLDAKRTYFDTLADYYESIAQVASSRAELESAVGAPLQSSLSTSAN